MKTEIETPKRIISREELNNIIKKFEGKETVNLVELKSLLNKKEVISSSKTKNKQTKSKKSNSLSDLKSPLLSSITQSLNKEFVGSKKQILKYILKNSDFHDGGYYSTDKIEWFQSYEYNRGINKAHKNNVAKSFCDEFVPSEGSVTCTIDVDSFNKNKTNFLKVMNGQHRLELFKIAGIVVFRLDPTFETEQPDECIHKMSLLNSKQRRMSTAEHIHLCKRKYPAYNRFDKIYNKYQQPHKIEYAIFSDIVWGGDSIFTEKIKQGKNFEFGEKEIKKINYYMPKLLPFVPYLKPGKGKSVHKRRSLEALKLMIDEKKINMGKLLENIKKNNDKFIEKYSLTIPHKEKLKELFENFSK